MYVQNERKEIKAETSFYNGIRNRNRRAGRLYIQAEERKKSELILLQVKGWILKRGGDGPDPNMGIIPDDDNDHNTNNSLASRFKVLQDERRGCKGNDTMTCRDCPYDHSMGPVISLLSSNRDEERALPR